MFGEHNFLGFGLWFVDPCRFRQWRRHWQSSNEPLGMGFESRAQNNASLADNCFGFAIMNHFRSKQPDSTVAMFAVVPGKEILAKDATILDGAEAIGKTWTIFQRLKLRLGVRIIIGHMRAAVTLRDAEIGEQQRNRLGFHRRTTVRMNRQPSRHHVLFLARFRNEALSERTALVGGNHPADDVSAEDVENHVRVTTILLHLAMSLILMEEHPETNRMTEDYGTS